MKFKLLIIAAGLLSYSLMIQAASKSVKAPSLFHNGPAAITAIKLESHEIVSLMLLESISDIASAAVLANSCQSATGNYSFEISADGAINKPENNVVKISSPGSSESLVLNAALEATDSFSFLGQKTNIRQTKNGKLKETLIQEYSSVATVNRELSLLSMHSHANVSGQNNTLIPQQNILLKHFYEEQTNNQNQYILGWGSASSSKSDYPVNLDWIRFKALKANGQLKRVVIQKDQLIGTLTCRILIDTAADLIKDNEKEIQKKVVLKGVMTITVPVNYEDNPVAFEF